MYHSLRLLKNKLSNNLFCSFLHYFFFACLIYGCNAKNIKNNVANQTIEETGSLSLCQSGSIDDKQNSEESEIDKIINIIYEGLKNRVISNEKNWQRVYRILEKTYGHRKDTLLHIIAQRAREIMEPQKQVQNLEQAQKEVQEQAQIILKKLFSIFPIRMTKKDNNSDPVNPWNKIDELFNSENIDGRTWFDIAIFNQFFIELVFMQLQEYKSMYAIRARTLEDAIRVANRRIQKLKNKQKRTNTQDPEDKKCIKHIEASIQVIQSYINNQDPKTHQNKLEEQTSQKEQKTKATTQAIKNSTDNKDQKPLQEALKEDFQNRGFNFANCVIRWEQAKEKQIRNFDLRKGKNYSNLSAKEIFLHKDFHDLKPAAFLLCAPDRQSYFFKISDLPDDTCQYAYATYSINGEIYQGKIEIATDKKDPSIIFHLMFNQNQEDQIRNFFASIVDFKFQDLSNNEESRQSCNKDSFEITKQRDAYVITMDISSGSSTKPPRRKLAIHRKYPSSYVKTSASS